MTEINDKVELLEGICFPINKKTTDQHQQKYSSLLAKYKNHTHKASSSGGGSNMGFYLITCEDKFVLRKYTKVTYNIKLYANLLYHKNGWNGNDNSLKFVLVQH